MGYSVTIDVAGIIIAFRCKHKALYQALSQRYHQFTSNGQANFIFDISWVKDEAFGSFTPPKISFFEHMVQFESLGFKGCSDFINHTGKIKIMNASPMEVIDYFLRIIVSVMIFDRQGMMVHGAGIRHKGKGYLFFGHSGSGKTTVSRMSNGDDVLNDDLVILQPSELGWKMYSTPFWNPTQIEPKPVMVELTSIYHLVQNRSVFIRSLKPAQALAELIANIPIISSDVNRSQLLVDRILSLLQIIPAYQLHFLPDNSFWQLIELPQD